MTKDELEILEEIKKKKSAIIVYNPRTLHELKVRSILEVPNGYILKHMKKSRKTRDRMSESAKKRGAPQAAYRDKTGENNPMYGKQQSEESLKKMKETKRNKKATEPYYGVCGKKVYHNPNTKEIRYFKPEDLIPDGFIKGRPKKAKV